MESSTLSPPSQSQPQAQSTGTLMGAPPLPPPAPPPPLPVPIQPLAPPPVPAPVTTVAPLAPPPPPPPLAIPSTSTAPPPILESSINDPLPPPPPPPPLPVNSAPSTSATVTAGVEEKEELASHDEFTDEESEIHTGSKTNILTRTVTLQMLLDAKILQPAEGAMTIEYLGQRFVGDLLPDGKIKSHETETIFCSPSAWAIHCKRIINPDKKSGCGWASVKYKGKKLDAYKTAWFRKMQQQREDTTPTDDEVEAEVEQPPAPPPQRIVVKHNTVPNKMIQHDANTLVEAVSFSSIGKVQPFLISISTNACFVLDLHCHLTASEVCGYLGGSWDINTHTLAVTHAFPCLKCKGDDKPAVLVEAQIHMAMERMGLTLIGWYHSHPVNAAMPTLRDCDSQLEYQIRKRGPSDITYSPCIGIICSPYNPESPVLESSLSCFWVTPPPEQRPTEYPRPFLMQYNVSHDTHMSPHAMEQITKSVKYYASSPDEKAIKFLNQYKSDVTYLEKLKSSLAAKFPREQSDGLLWNFIKDALGCSTEGDDKLDLDALLAVSQPLPIPKSQPNIIPNVPSVSVLQQMVSLPSVIPPLTIPSNAFGSLASGKYDLPTHLNIPIPPSSSKSSKNSNSLSSLGLASGLDVLTGMTLGLGAVTSVPLCLPTSSYDALTANSLLANLPPGISTSLAATLTGAKLTDPSIYTSLLSGRTGTDKSNSLAHSSVSATATASSLAASLASTMTPNHASNLMLSSAEIANALFQAGKFPSTSALLGIPDPMSQSILDANNMYLSPSLLKMQDTLNLLKPLSSSSPLVNKNMDHNLYFKGAQDLMKSAKEYLPPDLNISTLKSANKLDFSLSSDLSITKQPDVSISTIAKVPKVSECPEYAITDSFLNQMLQLTKKAGKADFSSDSGPPPAKMPKLDDYNSSLNLSASSALNLSSHSSLTEPSMMSESEVQNLSIPKKDIEKCKTPDVVI